MQYKIKELQIYGLTIYMKTSRTSDWLKTRTKL